MQFEQHSKWRDFLWLSHALLGCVVLSIFKCKNSLNIHKLCCTVVSWHQFTWNPLTHNMLWGWTQCWRPVHRKQYLPIFNKFTCLGDYRDLRLPPSVYQQAVDLLRNNAEFTVAASLRQEESNSGTIVAFSHGFNRYVFESWQLINTFYSYVNFALFIIIIWTYSWNFIEDKDNNYSQNWNFNCLGTT